MSAELRVFEVATTQHYGPDGVLVAEVGERVKADASRPLPAGWAYVVERVDHDEKKADDESEQKQEAEADPGSRSVSEPEPQPSQPTPATSSTSRRGGRGAT